MDLAPFKKLIKERCGLIFDEEKSTTLSRSLLSRMSSRNLKCHAEYFSNISSNDDEFHSLINLLTVNETYFFRESAHYRLFSEIIVPELINKKKPGQKIKILSAGCSTGEEAYSLSLALIEKYGMGSESFFSVMGCDIDRKVIEIARKGVYTKKSFRGFNNGLKEKYFSAIGPEKFQVTEPVKKMVEFRNFNLLSDFYPEHLTGFDVIFYRNVSIYFEHETQKKVFKRLSQVLNEKGHIFVSSTETFFHNVGILSLIERDGLFLYKKNLEVRNTEQGKSTPKWPGAFEFRQKRSLNLGRKVYPLSPLSLKPKRIKEKSKTPVRPKNKDTGQLYDEVLSLVKNKKYEDALNSINELLKEHQDFIKAQTLKASVLTQLQRLEEAKEVCVKAIGKDQWNLEGYLLLGLIAKIENNEDEMVKRFKEALYIQPSSWLSHFYLAEVYLSREELNRAYKEYRIVLNLLEKGSITDHGLAHFPLSFQAEQLTHLCCHNINQLRKRLEQ